MPDSQMEENIYRLQNKNLKKETYLTRVMIRLTKYSLIDC